MVKISSVVSLSKFPYGYDPAHYPFKGIRYVLSHRKLWRQVALVACFGMTTAFILVILLFVFALKPQADAFGGQWWSWLLAVLLVFLEAAVAAAILLVYTRSKAESEVFVTTMKIEGMWKEGMVKPNVVRHFNIFKKAFYVRILTYPLVLIPFFGSGLYAAINATFIGWDYMDMYFDVIRMDMKTQRVEVLGEDKSDFKALLSPWTYDDDNQYARFGFMCAMIETVPIVGPVIFPLFNSCAAALFACDIENKGGPMSMRQNAKTRALPNFEENGDSYQPMNSETRALPNLDDKEDSYQHPEVPDGDDINEREYSA